jgi:rare lipoprotein A (peptidoglycan hydrolase)
MLTAPSDGTGAGVARTGFLRAARRSRLRAAILSLGAGLGCFVAPAAWAESAAISRAAVQTSAAKVTPSPSPTSNPKKWGKLEGNAVWYDVPVNSLAHRRAGKGELTAAHNRLPLGTMVRVTHLANKKNVIVRITDRGITSRRVLIDLCKEAAAKLEMLKEGSARVRLEILPDDRGVTAPADSTATKANP